MDASNDFEQSYQVCFHNPSNKSNTSTNYFEYISSNLGLVDGRQQLLKPCSKSRGIRGGHATVHPKYSSSIIQKTILVFALLLQVLDRLHHVSAQDPSLDYYCGKDWTTAIETCQLACPTGEDLECTSVLGVDFSCYYFTGCYDKIQSGFFDNIDAGDGGNSGGEGGNSSSVRKNSCGKTWIDAMLTCDAGKECDEDTDCTGSDEYCHANTNCEQELVEIESVVTVFLIGPTKEMGQEEKDVFQESLLEVLGAAVSDDGFVLIRVKFEEQKLSDGELQVSVVVNGQYRPPPFRDLAEIAGKHIEQKRGTVVSILRIYGPLEGTYYFDKVSNIQTFSDTTNVPTKSPVSSTFRPTTKPVTDIPSAMPSDHPSVFVTFPPTRTHDQVIKSGNRGDIQLGTSTTSLSYGFVFTAQTKPDSGVILIDGLDFYTESTDELSFELWTKAGPYKDAKGTYEGWDLIASGFVKGNGVGKYTSIPTELLTPVAVNGSGGMRSFLCFVDISRFDVQD